MNDERFNELALEHILSGLTGGDLIEYRRELGRRGAAGLREVDQLRESLAALALTAPAVAPPAELKKKLLEQVRGGTTNSVPEDTFASEDAVAPDDADEPIGAVLPTRRRHEHSRRSGRDWSRGWLVAAAVASLLAVGFGALNLRLQSQLRQARAELDAARFELANAEDLASRLNALQGDLVTVSSPETNTVTLTGTSEQPGGRARVFIDPLTGRALVFVYDLEVLGPDLVYQLWAIKGSTPTDAGVFTVDANGQGRLETADIDVLLDADVMAVTVEPSPGQPSPTGAIVLSS